MAAPRIHLAVSVSDEGTADVLYIGADSIAAEDAFNAAKCGDNTVQLYKHLMPLRRRCAADEAVPEVEPAPVSKKTAKSDS